MSNNKNNNPLWNFAKYLPANDIALNLILPVVVVLIVFTVLQIKDPENLSLNLVISGVFYFGLAGFMIISNVYGKKRHRSALYGKALSPLTEMGFEIENIENYWGYKGVYKNYFFRIYYNWDTRLSRKIDFREIDIQLYFVPLEIGKNKFDVEKIMGLNKKYKNSLWKPKINTVNFGVSFIEYHYPFNMFTSFENIKASIEETINIANAEGLIPINEKEVNKLVEYDAYSHGPTIETFWKAKGVIS